MLESEISQAIIKFEKDYMGRGPLETRTFLVEDMILVRLKKVLTPAELKLAGDEMASRRALVKQVRHELLEHGRSLLEAAITGILDVNVISLHTDLSTKTGERIIVFTLDKVPQFQEN
ncbi:MAG: DUF2294 domain-containing protein [Planctomycetota bacterium]